jgi:hypothetical protein
MTTIIIPNIDEVQCYTCYKWVSYKECGVGFPPIPNCKEGSEVWYCKPCHEEHLNKCGKCWKDENDCECSCDCVEGSYIDPECIMNCDKCKHRRSKCLPCEWCLLKEAIDTPTDKRTPQQQQRVDELIATHQTLNRRL